ncbi:MAG: type I CRISPR-associated protein Cas7 [Salinivirgaceae bacterium]|jgi:CRISPR-associated protein Csh2|nr:type I CRISPR-associated protein Cas7 [Salinivirgaceae bacterium]
MEFKNRVFGCAVVKAINSNYNADFTGQPRTLPDGTVYATDKAFKYTVKNYFKQVHPQETIFYFKSLNENMNPISLDETYVKHFGDYPSDKKTMKQKVGANLLSCIDVRLFGATFAGKTNISIHGPVQINHGINIWHENNIFSEQITAPFSNKSNDADAEKGMTTIGRQSKLQEGHYVHHFSINPANLNNIADLAGEDAKRLSQDDIKKLKTAMRQGATLYDSASKAGCDNEILFWVQLKEDSKLILPSFNTLIQTEEEKEEEKTVFNFEKLSALLNQHGEQIEKIELFINQHAAKAINAPENCKQFELFGEVLTEVAL